ncbi:MAG: hypothetical protein AAGA37_12975 [Actinomycetota bacterium]
MSVQWMRPSRWVAVASAGVFVIGVVVATATPGPLLTIDDVANFGLAHTIAGKGSAPMPAQAPYGPLYPALLAPGWLLGFDEGAMLTWARTINALAGAALVPVLFAFVRRVSDVSGRAALAAATAAAMLPAGMLTGSIAWSERLLWLLVAAAALAMVHSLDRSSPQAAALALAAAVGLFAGHPRLGPAAMVVIGVAVWSLRRRGVGWGVATGAVGAAGLVIVERVRSAVATAAFDSSGTYDAGDLASRRGVDVLVPEAGQHAMGAVTYLVLAGGLLAVWGAVGLAQHRRTWPVLLMGSAVLAVAAWFLTGVPRADKWLHGRYIEVMAPLLVAVGFATITRVRARLALVLGVGVPIGAGVVAAWNGPGNTWAQARSPVMMLGVEVSGAPYAATVFEPGAAASVAIVAGLLVWAAARRFGVMAGAVVLVATFGFGYHAGDRTLDELYVNTPVGEVSTALPPTEVIGEVFLDTAAVSPNLTNAVAWEVGFDRSSITMTDATTHVLLAVATAPPANAVLVAEFADGSLWRLDA